MNSEIFSPFKSVFKILGFEPFEKRDFLTNLCSMCHFVFAIIQSIIVVIYLNDTLYDQDGIGKLVEKIDLVTIFCAYFAAIYVSWRYQNCYVNISNQMEKLEILMEKFHMNVKAANENLFKSFKWKFTLVVFFHILAISHQFLFHSRNKEFKSIRLFLALLLPRMFSVMKHIQGIFYINMVNEQIKILN
jgi:hypothetical protein